MIATRTRRHAVPAAALAFGLMLLLVAARAPARASAAPSGGPSWTWTALGASQDSRLEGVDIDRLVERARSQLIRLEPYRLRAAAGALRA